MQLRMTALVCFVVPPLCVYAQQQATYTWTGDCPICQSSIIKPGWNADGSGMFTEAIESEKAFAIVGISGNGPDYEVALSFGPSQAGSVTINPVDDVTIETNSSPHMVLRAMEQPDPHVSKTDVGVQHQFPDKPITVLFPGDPPAGFLFFPSDFDASAVTVVVRLGDETYRFPFAKSPSVRGKFENPELALTNPSRTQPMNLSNTKAAQMGPPTTGVQTQQQPPIEPILSSSGLCAKNISFAVIDGARIVPRVPKFTRKWVAKNQRKYSGLCFSQSPNPQAQNFLLLFSTSQASFNGIFPTVKTSTNTDISPVSGAGTVTSSTGETWDYSYSGTETTTVTTTTQEDLPYTDTTTGLFLNVYDQNGALVSREWRSVTTRQGGDAANTVGYNLGSALMAIHIKERLLKAAVDDVAR